MIADRLALGFKGHEDTIERVVGAGPPGEVTVDGRRMVNMASCDYLGLARHPAVVAAAGEALTRWGIGAAAGRVLSGTTTLHRQLERNLAAWVGCEDAVLHNSCWSANEALFASLAQLAAASDSRFAVFSDRLNHASIIDAIRAQRSHLVSLSIYDRSDLASLARELAPDPATLRVIVTDGVFSMEGDLAPLQDLVALADASESLLVVDDSHGTGVVGSSGRGSAEARGVFGRVDVIAGTIGKALGGAGGGYIASSAEMTTWLRATSRPYRFSNNPPPAVLAAALECLAVLQRDPAPLATLRARTRQLREGVSGLGLKTVAGEHPIVPILLQDEVRTSKAAAKLRERGVFAVSLSYPVVAHGQARIRLQVSASHSASTIGHVLAALEEI